VHLVDQVQDSVRLAVRRMRELMFELRPPELDRAGLAAAAREFSAQLNDPKTNVRMSIDVDDRLAIEPSDEVRGVAYRIIAEALTNAARHSRASQVDVSLTEVDAGLLIRVRDDGIGIDSDIVENGRPGHFGLVSVRERAEMLGGWSKIVSRTRGGTTVEAWLPVGRTISRVGLDGKRV
jgi:signal transduction histidine kinase